MLGPGLLKTPKSNKMVRETVHKKIEQYKNHIKKRGVVNSMRHMHIIAQHYLVGGGGKTWRKWSVVQGQ